MLSLTAAAPSSPSSSSSLFFFRRRGPCGFPRFFCSSSSPSSEQSSAPPQPEKRAPRGNHGGVRLEESVERGTARSRLDAWISSRIGGVSRARIQASIRSGLVSVNGRTIDKVPRTLPFADRPLLIDLDFRRITIRSTATDFCTLFENLSPQSYQVSHIIKPGDRVNCTVSELQPLRAEPEDIPLDIVYEDPHILVVNKPANMVLPRSSNHFSWSFSEARTVSSSSF